MIKHQIGLYGFRKVGFRVIDDGRQHPVDGDDFQLDGVGTETFHSLGFACGGLALQIDPHFLQGGMGIRI